jgi:methionyl-tRNA formyltransferase
VVTDDIATCVEVLSQITPSTMGLSFGAPWLFRQDVITRFGGRLLNLHGARLPHYRGGGGFSWQILCDNRQGYALIHQITAGIDDGPIVAVREFRYPSSCRVPQDYQQVLLHEYEGLLDDFFPALAAHREFPTAAQPEYLRGMSLSLLKFSGGSVDGYAICRSSCAMPRPS